MSQCLVWLLVILTQGLTLITWCMIWALLKVSGKLVNVCMRAVNVFAAISIVRIRMI